MKKYNCNNTLEYAHEVSRMCRTIGDCDSCPIDELSCEANEISKTHINIVQAWSDAHPEITLTNKQVEIFKALNLLGFKYIAKDSDGKIYAYTDRPEKFQAIWFFAIGECITIKHLRAGVFDAISSLVSWSDTEPLNMVWALEQTEKTKQ